MEVGLHQRSALSPLSRLKNVMDRLTDEIGQESPWTTMFAVGKKSLRVSNGRQYNPQTTGPVSFFKPLRGTLAKNHQ